MTTVSLPILDKIQIAKPCPARWEDMKGDDVTRHCSLCDLNVHNLSAMTRGEAESFLASRRGEGRTCAGFFRRADGTILTKDCPVGIARWKAKAIKAVSRVAAALFVLLTGGAALSSSKNPDLTTRLRSAEPFRSVCEWFNPQIAAAPPIVPRAQILMLGDIAVPAPPPAPPQSGSPGSAP